MYCLSVLSVDVSSVVLCVRSRLRHLAVELVACRFFQPVSLHAQSGQHAFVNCTQSVTFHLLSEDNPSAARFKNEFYNIIHSDQWARF